VDSGGHGLPQRALWWVKVRLRLVWMMVVSDRLHVITGVDFSFRFE